MSTLLDSMIGAFRTTARRPAVFDRTIRERVGAWRLDSPCPVEDILQQFANYDAFVNGSTVLIPLHEQQSPELTGEYLEYRAGDPEPAIWYYDFKQQGMARISLQEFATTYPASRIRFWHPDTEPAQTPSFVYENGSVDDVQFEQSDDSVSSVKPPDDDIFEDLRSFVEAEREAERQKHREMFDRMASSAYISSIGGIPHLTGDGMVVGEYGQQSVVLTLSSPPDQESYPSELDISSEFGVHEGNEVLVDVRDDDLEGFPVEAEILSIQGKRLEVGVYWNRTSPVGPAEDTFSDPGETTFCIGHLVNPVTFDREIEAVGLIEEASRKREMLTGAGVPEFAESRSQTIRESRLNAFQQQAAQQALRAEDIYCIHGPPGTGKTRTLVEIITALAKEGNRVLVCTHSNQAIDNLLVGSSTDEIIDSDSLHSAASEGDITVARVGEHSTNDIVNAEYVGNDRYQSDVVCTTTSGAAHFGEDIFEYAILDEASQASIPSSLIPYSRAERLILAGDHKQLPPYHSSENQNTEEFEISLFEQFLERYDEGIRTTLRTQYRMNKAIAGFPNKQFYNGTLKHGSRNRSWTVGPLEPLEAYNVSGDENRSPSKSYYNETEVAVVSREVQRLLDTGVTGDQIGIITPYSGQVSKITAALRGIDSQIQDIEIDTVDSFQGSEREVIIVSFVRSNDTGQTGFLTFPNEGPRRLNVAMTRAKRRLVLVGDFETLGQVGPNKTPETSSADVYQDLQEYLEANGRFADPPD